MAGMALGKRQQVNVLNWLAISWGIRMSKFFLGILPVVLLVHEAGSGLALEVNKYRKPQVQVGDVAPAEVGGDSSHGDGIGIADDTFKGKFVLVVYWSPGDVKRELWESKLRDIRKAQLKNPDFRILSICVSADFEAWMKYLDQAPPLDVDGHKVKIYSDRIWWQLHVMDWKPPESVVDKSQLPAAHLIGKDGRFIAVRVPLKDLVSTVAANVHKP